MVALPVDFRLKYVDWMKEHLPGIPQFMELIEFANSEIGPPFSISEKTLSEYYGDDYTIKNITEEEFYDGVHSQHIESHKTKLYFLLSK